MKPSLKNTRYVLSSQSLLTMSVVLIVVWIYIFLAPAPVNVSEVSLPWFATATPAASVTPTKTATPTVIPSPTATLVPTATPQFSERYPWEIVTLGVNTTQEVLMYGGYISNHIELRVTIESDEGKSVFCMLANKGYVDPDGKNFYEKLSRNLIIMHCGENEGLDLPLNDIEWLKQHIKKADTLHMLSLTAHQPKGSKGYYVTSDENSAVYKNGAKLFKFENVNYYECPQTSYFKPIYMRGKEVIIFSVDIDTVNEGTKFVITLPDGNALIFELPPTFAGNPWSEFSNLPVGIMEPYRVNAKLYSP
jgi:hypothetical protein